MAVARSPYSMSLHIRRESGTSRLPSILLVFPGSLCLAGGPALQARDFNDAEIANIGHPGWFKESLLDMPEDLEEAQRAGKIGLMVLTVPRAGPAGVKGY